MSAFPGIALTMTVLGFNLLPTRSATSEGDVETNGQIQLRSNVSASP